MAMQWQLLSLDEFATRFAHGCRYGNQRDPWPRDTILFYRLAGQRICIPWKKISSLSIPEHAEVCMLRDAELMRLLTSLPQATYTLEMVLSYSLCRRCSDELINFKNRFKTSSINLRITMRISSFYCTYKPLDTQNLDGLLNLVLENVILKTFDGDSDWMEFLRDVIYIPEMYLRWWLAVASNPNRRRREYVDRCILKDIYGWCRGEISRQNLCEMAAVASPMQVPDIYQRRNGQSFILQLGHH